MTAVEYSNLTPWTYPSDYGGQTWYGWFAVYSQTRDSDALDRSNYKSILDDLSCLSTDLAADAIDPRQGDYDSPGDPTVCDTRVGHWGPGWVEIIYVHSSNTAACERAEEILNALSDYPVFDESDLSETEHEDEEESWSNWYRSEFIQDLERPFESWLIERMDENGVDPAEADARVAAVMALFEDLNFDLLMCNATRDSDVYWEHSSEGASIDTARVAKSITNEELLELCGENESIFSVKRYCNFDPFQAYLSFVI